MPLELTEAYRNTLVVSDFTRLASLDGSWTSYLEHATGPIEAEAHSALELIASEMLDILSRSRDAADYELYLTYKYPEDVEANYEQLLKGEVAEPTGALIQTLSSYERLLPDAIARHGGILAYVRQGLTIMLDGADRERDELATKLASLRNEEATAGDLSKEFLCDIAKGCICGGILALASPPPIALVGLSTGVGILALLHFQGMDC